MISLAFDTTQITSPGNYSEPKPGQPCHPLAKGQHPPAIAYRDDRGRGDDNASENVTYPLHGAKGPSEQQVVAYQCHGSTVGEMGTVRSGNQGVTGGVPFVPIDMRQASRGDKMTNNRKAGSSGGPPGTGIGEPSDPSPSLAKSHPPAIAGPMMVRRLTPVECERLMGLPDNYTLIPYRNKPAGQCPDGPRYRALGNSMAVPVMRWIGRRILETVDATHGGPPCSASSAD